MYLSRVEIDTNNRQKIKCLTHLGAYHNWVEQSFPQEISVGKRSRKLWRIDQLGGKTYLLIVSKELPDFEALCRYGVEGTVQSKDYDRFLDKLKNGTKCLFRVVLNPVVALPHSGDKRGRIMPHITVEQQRNYLLKRASEHGFYISNDEFSIVEREFVNWHKGKDHVRLSRVTYEGLLTIENIDDFRTLLIEGMGKKKAYGFGMMTVIPKEM